MAVAVDRFGHMGAPGTQMQKIGTQKRHQALGRAHGRPGRKGKKDLGFVVWLLPPHTHTQGPMYPKLALTLLSSQRQLPPPKSWDYRCIPGLLYVRLGMEPPVLCMIGEHSTT